MTAQFFTSGGTQGVLVMMDGTVNGSWANQPVAITDFRGSTTAGNFGVRYMDLRGMNACSVALRVGTTAPINNASYDVFWSLDGGVTQWNLDTGSGATSVAMSGAAATSAAYSTLTWYYTLGNPTTPYFPHPSLFQQNVMLLAKGAGGDAARSPSFQGFYIRFWRV